MEFLSAFDLEECPVRAFTNGYYFNYIIFWSTAKPVTVKGREQEGRKFSLRDAKQFRSNLTSMSYIENLSSMEDKMKNMQFLNAKILPRLRISLTEEQINAVVSGSRDVI